jgi:hypothetical protein
MPLSHADAQRQAMSATSQKGVAMIRYFFFALVLLMAICPAPARATELPKHMLGLWCFNKIATEELDTDNTSVWDKAASFDDCANRGGVKLWRQGNQSGYVIGRFNRRAHCKIDKLKLSRPGVYLLHSNCRDDAGAWTEHFELSRKSEQTLLRREASES